MSQENVKQQFNSIMESIAEQSEKCAGTGFPTTWKCAVTGAVDRIDNTKGYVKNNVKFTV